MTTDRRIEVADALSVLLADSYTLYLKTHNFHWNVTGPMFTTLHTLFEQQYTELALAVDEIAERIRALGRPAPGSYKQFTALTRLKDADGIPDASAMIRELVGDLDLVIEAAKTTSAAAAAAGDEASADLAVRRIDITEKNAWMLRSHLE
jgi:starvation-inducible DNA-binding protein